MKGKTSFLIAWLLNTLGNGQDWDSTQMLSFVFPLCFRKIKNKITRENMEPFLWSSQKEITVERNDES